MKNHTKIFILLLGDILMLTASFFVMLAIAFPGNIEGVLSSHIVPFAFTGAVWILTFFIFGLYDTEHIRPTIPNFKRIGIASIVAAALSAILFYSIPAFGITPKTNIVIFGASFALFYIIWRRTFSTIFAKYFLREVTIIAKVEDEYVKELVDYTKKHPQCGIAIKGIRSSLGDFTGDALDIASAYELVLDKIPLSHIDEAWILSNVKANKKRFYEFTSRLLGIVVSLSLIIITLPILLLIAIPIKLYDGGPVFFSQLRAGKNGRPFKFYKFRSMVVNADKGGAKWTEDNDKRITPVGKIIRKLHVDETPQLLNILKGDMALVGPRPELANFVDELGEKIPYYKFRHTITPGFTGWAQIRYRQAKGIDEIQEKFAYDLYYIKNRNIFMDIGVLIRTVTIIFTH